MSNDESIESIAAGRLTGPGVVDREPVLRLYDRLQHPLPTSALADRLRQRAAHAEHADGSSLVWQRTSLTSSAFVPPPPPTPEIGHATTPSVRQPPVQRFVPEPLRAPDIGHATTPSMQQRPVQRSMIAAPGSTAAPARVQRLTQGQDAPGIVAVSDNMPHAGSESPARYGVQKATSPFVSRAAASTTTTSAPVVMRKADSTTTPRVQQTPLASLVSRSSNPTLPSATRSTSTFASMPMSIARKQEASTARDGSTPGGESSTIAPARTAPVIAHTPSSSSAATPLVLRRVAAPVPASASMPPMAYGMPSSSAVAHELTQAAQAEGTASVPHTGPGGAAAQGGESDIGRLAEEVERRLRLRLEIERERRGIRSWR